MLRVLLVAYDAYITAPGFAHYYLLESGCSNVLDSVSHLISTDRMWMLHHQQHNSETEQCKQKTFSGRTSNKRESL